MTTNDPYRGLGWAHGALTVQRLGAMLGPVTFVLPDGRQVNPHHVAPWADEPESAAQPGVLRKLRGEWPCLPFGYTASPEGFAEEWAKLFTPAEPDEQVHGYCSNNDWRWEKSEDGTLKLSYDYPKSNPVSRVERTITPDPNATAIDLEFRAEVREDCRLPVGLHPTFRLPQKPGAARIEPGRFDHGRTYPGKAEPGTEIFAEDATFTDLAKVPARKGGTIDASRVPFAVDTEELLELNGIDGTAALANEAEGYRVRVRWQKEHFPSLLLWYSNRGRKFAPWNGRNLCLGVEPICSPFGFGVSTAAADNPIARSGTPTVHAFKKGEPFVTRYRIEAEAL